MITRTQRFSLVSGIVVFSLPLLSLAAAPGTAEAASFVTKFNTIILFPTIALLSAVAFLVFLWGCAEYFFNAANETARAQGVKHITWGIIGLVIMFSAFAILRIAAGTFGLTKQLDCASKPSGAGCDSAFTIPGGSSGGTLPSSSSGGTMPSSSSGGSVPSSGYIPPDP
jgi:hypothetical protein